MIDICGQRCTELCKNVSQDSLLLKMCLEFYIILTPSSVTWKTKVTPAGRSLYQLVSCKPRIKGKGYGLLPTPTRSDATMGKIIGKNKIYRTNSNGKLRRYNKNGNSSSLSLGRLLM